MIKYKDIDLSAKAIIIRILIAIIIGILLFIVLPKVIHYLNFPKYTKNSPFKSQYLYESKNKDFNDKIGVYQEVYNRGVGEQKFDIEPNRNTTLDINVDCFNRKGVLNIYIVDDQKKIMYSLKALAENNLVKEVKIPLQKNKKYFLILDHHYTFGGLFIKWSYTDI